jgi:methionine-S-sulfoxide reductase
MKTEKAIFAGGCFWGIQFYFDQVPGVVKTTAGYTGGHTKNPTYEEVCTHATGHAEAVLIEFDPTKVTYKTLLTHFFKIHDPTQLNRQGPDIGDSYRTAIFTYDKQQKKLAEAAKQAIQKKYDKTVVTEIVDATEFYPAEAYHQKFAERTGRGMCHVPYEPIS